jgi:isopenicillin N synthase-like dioxygenase
LRRRDGLIKHAKNNTSQNGEDGVIARLFQLLPFSNKRFCVDVGAWDGVHLSNTHSLLVRDEKQNAGSSWSGVLIEADPLRFKSLKKLHDSFGNISVCAEVSCDPSSPQSLKSILKQFAPDLPLNFDFLSIDVDGMDYWVMANVLGMSADCTDTDASFYQPKVICVEFNPTMPTDLVYVQPRSDSIRHGSSLSAFVELATASGYTLVETTLFNAFFIQTDLYEQYLKDEVPDTSIEALQSPLSMGTQLYQLYDGTIKLWGCKRMLWHRMPIDEKDLQIIPAHERQFPFSPSCNDSKDNVNNGIRENAIDMSPYCKQHCLNDSEESINSRRHCAAELNSMLQKDGFALVSGTGIRGNTCINALRAAQSFLHDADETVRRSCLTKDRARRGYSPMATENFASLVGQEAANDLVKKYRVGPDSRISDDTVLSSLHQPNAWPRTQVWGEDDASFFRKSIEEYFEQTRLTAGNILSAICDGINANNNGNNAHSIEVLSRQSKNHTSILTLLGYQYGSRHKKGSKGYMRPLVAAHTDVGVLTLLLYDSGKCASLQRVADASKADPTTKEWVDVILPPIQDDPVFVVNVGDCLSELTAGSLRSTMHRVMPQPCKKEENDAARTCLALFVGLEPSACLTLPANDGDTITYEEWRKRRIAKATAVLKSQKLNNS